MLEVKNLDVQYTYKDILHLANMNKYTDTCENGNVDN